MDSINNGLHRTCLKFARSVISTLRRKEAEETLIEVEWNISRESQEVAQTLQRRFVLRRITQGLHIIQRVGRRLIRGGKTGHDKRLPEV